jgi:ElaB/YqjD/DUF883 family membrane-anchored ribosome-binding protein
MERADFTNRLQDWQRRASEKAKNLGQTTDHYVRENTWSTLLVAALVGCLVGYFLTSDRD